MTERILTQDQIDILRDMLYDRAAHSHLFHRTGETFTDPLFGDWIQAANLFRDADRVVISVRPGSITEELDKSGEPWPRNATWPGKAEARK